MRSACAAGRELMVVRSSERAAELLRDKSQEAKQDKLHWGGIWHCADLIRVQTYTFLTSTISHSLLPLRHQPGSLRLCVLRGQTHTFVAVALTTRRPTRRERMTKTMVSMKKLSRHSALDTHRSFGRCKMPSHTQKANGAVFPLVTCTQYSWCGQCCAYVCGTSCLPPAGFSAQHRIALLTCFPYGSFEFTPSSSPTPSNRAGSKKMRTLASFCIDSVYSHQVNHSRRATRLGATASWLPSPRRAAACVRRAAALHDHTAAAAASRSGRRAPSLTLSSGAQRAELKQASDQQAGSGSLALSAPTHTSGPSPPSPRSHVHSTTTRQETNTQRRRRGWRLAPRRLRRPRRPRAQLAAPPPPAITRSTASSATAR